jgi:hypothetical protein
MGVLAIGIAVDQGADRLAPGGIVANVERKVADKAPFRVALPEFTGNLGLCPPNLGSLGANILNKFNELYRNSL